MTASYDEGPDICRLCGESTLRQARFFEAFPDRDGERAAFPLSEDPPPVPSWRMTACQRCGTVAPTPYPAAAEIGDYYASSDQADEWEVEHYVRIDLNAKALQGKEAFADQLTRSNGRPGRLLEVGCASGWILKAARDRGWEVKGIEAAPKFSRYARDELGLDIFAGAVSELDPEGEEPFDTIIAFDVFEHLHDPVGDLRVLRRLAHGGSRLMITTPNISSLCAHGYGLRWRQILPSHINLATHEGIRAALERSGWKLDHLSEPKYWDPDLRQERRNKVRELGKFGARAVLNVLIVQPSRRLPSLKRIPTFLTRGKMTWSQFLFRVGDQPVLGDVMFVVARPA